MDDVISRNALFREMEKAQWYNNADRDEIAEELVLNAPTIEPERKTGQWNYSDDMFETAVCSCCGWDSGESVRYARENFNYCPKCGEKMER